MDVEIDVPEDGDPQVTMQLLRERLVAEMKRSKSLAQELESSQAKIDAEFKAKQAYI